MNKVPGVGDNKTYKDMYPFNQTRYFTIDKKALSSVNASPDINSTIKENPYRSNVEIEKDEVVLQPDLSALFKAKGKTHKQGGIDVTLRPDSFVFSNDPTLAFSESDHKLFEFKEGGTFKKDKNTPADVLKRNIDVKHYNTLIANITDIKKDDLAKKSSAMMLEKYIKTLGGIAYLQEQKKNFPQGLPAFSDGSAPVYNSNVKEKVMEQKQYAKYGGTINPYSVGGPILPCPCGKDANGKCLPCSDDVYNSILPKARKVDKALPGYDPLYTAPNGTKLYGKFGEKNVSTPYNGPLMSNDKWRAFLASPQGIKWKQTRATQDTEDYLRIDPSNPNPPQDNPGGIGGRPYQVTPQVSIIPGDVTGASMQGKDINWQFSPWQKISQGYNLAKLASVKRYMPYRSHLNASYIDPSLVNSEQTVGDMKASFNQNLNGINSLSPILRNAQAQSTYGQLLNQIPGVRSQYDNQNVGIINQFKQYNNQIKNNESVQNMQNDQNYYQQVVTGNVNFDNMKTFLGDQYMNNLMGDVQDNQALAYNLATLKNPAYGYNFRSGNFYRNPKSVLDVDSTSNTQENLIELAKSLRSQGFGEKLVGDIIKSKAFQTWNPTQKKGGRIGYNPYK